MGTKSKNLTENIPLKYKVYTRDVNYFTATY